MEKENKFNNMYDTILENALGSSYGNSNDALGVGGKGMTVHPQQVSFLDIIAGIERDRRKRRPDLPVIGYPLQNRIPDDLAEVVDKLSGITARFAQAHKNPVLKDNEKASKAVKTILKKLVKTGKILLSLKNDLDDLVVEH